MQLIFEADDLPCKMCDGTGVAHVGRSDGGLNDRQQDECPWCLRREITAKNKEITDLRAVTKERIKQVLFDEGVPVEELIRLRDDNKRLREALEKLETSLPDINADCTDCRIEGICAELEFDDACPFTAIYEGKKSIQQAISQTAQGGKESE